MMKRKPTMRRTVKYGHCLCSSPYRRIPSNVQTPFGMRLCGSNRSRFCRREAWSVGNQGHDQPRGTHVVIDAEVHFLSSFLLLLDKARCQASTSRINDRSTLFPLHRGMKTQVLSTCEAEPPKVFFVAKLLCSIFHQGLQLHECLLNL